MRDSVRHLLNLAPESDMKILRDRTPDLSLAQLDPTPRTISGRGNQGLSNQIQLPNLPPTPLNDNEDNAVIETKADSAATAEMILRLVAQHAAQVEKLQDQLRQMDVERARAKEEAILAKETAERATTSLSDTITVLDDERLRREVAQARAHLVERAAALPFWRWGSRKEFLQQATMLRKALPAE